MHFRLLGVARISSDALSRRCRCAMAECDMPLAQIYEQPSLADYHKSLTTLDYLPMVGPFPANIFGQRTLLQNLQLFTCQGQNLRTNCEVLQ